MTAVTTVLGSAHSIVFQQVAFSACWLGLAGGSLALAWRRRSLVLVAVAAVLTAYVGWLLQPWLALAPQEPPGNSGEPNLLAWWRVVSGVWLLLVLGGLGSAVTLLQLRRL